MKKRFYLSVFVTFLMLSCFNGRVIVAQTSPECFTADAYKLSIAEIAARSDGRLDDKKVLEILANDGMPVYNPDYQLGDTIYMIPEIKVVSYDATSAMFEYVISENFWQDSIVVTFPGNPSWITNPEIDTINKSIIVTISPNTTFAPRTGEVKISATSGGVTLSFSSFILQQPMPAQLIIVSPDYSIETPQGGLSEVFAVTHINVDAWTVNESVNWLQVHQPSVTDDSFRLQVSPNLTGIGRTALVIVRDASDPSISDTLLVMQQAAFILLSPDLKILPCAGGSFNVDIFRYNVGSIRVLYRSQQAAVQVVSNDAINVTLPASSLPGMARDTVVICSVQDSVITDTLFVYRMPCSQPYILLSPRIQFVGWDDAQLPAPFIIATQNTGIITATTNSPWITPQLIGDTALQATLQPNTSAVAREAIIIISDPAAGVSDEIKVVQAGVAAYVQLNPEFATISYAGGLSDVFTINSANVPVWEVALLEPAEWISDTIINGSTLVFGVAPNTSNSPRQVVFKVFDATNPAVADTGVIFQNGAPVPALLAAPRLMSVGHAGSPQIDFQVTAANISGWQVDAGALAPWLTVVTQGDEVLSLEVSPNPNNQTRQAEVVLIATDNPAIADTVVVLQYAANDSYLLAAPRQQQVMSIGSDAVVFVIKDFNTGGWIIDEGMLPQWIQQQQPTDTLLLLKVLANPDNITRQAQIKIFGVNDPTVYDSVLVVQVAGADTILLAAPRQQHVLHTATTGLTFDITAVNIDQWQVDLSTLPNWMQVTASGSNILELNVDENPFSITRQGTVRLLVPDHPSVTDSVLVYQYSALDTFLLASPREQLVSAAGDNALTFDVTAVNISGWIVDAASVPPWIAIQVFGNDLLKLDIAPNDIDTIRQAVVYLHKDNNSAIYDSVFIFQYALPDTFLIAAPREQRVGFTGAAQVDFSITRHNVVNWQVDASTLPAWVALMASGGDDLQFSVDTNILTQTRNAFIRIFSTDHPQSDDTIKIYQYSALDTFLLVAPREQIVPYTGSDSINFLVQAVNTSNWQPDAATIPAWIQQDVLNDTLISFDVSPNVAFLTRQATIRLIDPANPAVMDSLQIFQLAAPAATLLAAPREIVVAHTGNPAASFVVTTANLANGWEVELQSVPTNWISVTEAGGEILTLSISANTTLESRLATIILRATDLPEIIDSVMIFQYAGLDRYLLCAPREQLVSHEATAGVLFTVTAANTGVWQVIPASVPDWISVTGQGGGLLALDVDQNISYESRQAIILVAAIDFPGVTDSVAVFQYSGLASYILGAPNEQEVSFYGGALMPFTITTTNVDAWDYTAAASWMSVQRVEEQLMVQVDTNNQLDSRYGFINIFSVSDTNVSDHVSVFQASSSQPYLAVLPAGLTSIEADGAQVELSLFSNILNYAIEKVPGREWYQLSDTTASGNDTILLTINENESSFLSRSSYLTFRSEDGIAQQYFYFQQKKNSANFINISGKVLIDGQAGTPADGVTIYIGEDSVYTQGANGGKYSYQAAYGWVGAITPRKENFYFEPASYTFETEQTDSVHADFTAVPIDPKIIFSNVSDTLAICAGGALAPGDLNYPLVSITGTYGQRGFRWLSQPVDTGLSSDSLSVFTQPIFSPLVTTNYALVMYNYGTTDTAFFTLKVNPLPPARDFDGMMQVCSQQAGVIYSVTGAAPGETFRWQLTPDAGTLTPVLDGSVAIIDWSNQPGDVTLSVATISRFGCEQTPILKTISISSEQAPEKVTVTKKTGDNMLLCSSADADRYEWGWYPIINGYLGQRYIIPQQGEWYCRLPHPFDPVQYKYFVITWDDQAACGSLSFFNPPLAIGGEATAKPFRIFPNPAHDQLFIEIGQALSTGTADFEMVSLSGQRIIQIENKPLINSINVFDIGRLPAGVYVVRIRIGQEYYHEKIIIQ